LLRGSLGRKSLPRQVSDLETTAPDEFLLRELQEQLFPAKTTGKTEKGKSSGAKSSGELPGMTSSADVTGSKILAERETG